MLFGVLGVVMLVGACFSIYGCLVGGGAGGAYDIHGPPPTNWTPPATRTLPAHTASSPERTFGNVPLSKQSVNQIDTRAPLELGALILHSTSCSLPPYLPLPLEP